MLEDSETLSRSIADFQPDAIVHLAAQAGVRYSIENPKAYLDANIIGTFNMMEAARAAGVQHLLMASTSSVYGANTEMPFSETERVATPLTFYAATKLANESMGHSYAHIYNLPVTMFRFFTVYGPWGRPDMAVWKFTEAVLNGQPIDVYNHGNMRRDFTFIDDIVAGVIASLDQPPADDGAAKPGGFTTPHRLYNIGNNRPEALMDLIAKIERACGHEATLNLLPMQDGDVYETYADISAIAGDLGYAPTTPIGVGVPRFVEWYRGWRG